MSDSSQNLLFFIGGIALGSLAVFALSKNNDGTRPALADLAAGALDLRDKAVGTLQRSKEDLSDFLSEVEHARAMRATRQPGGEASASAEAGAENGSAGQATSTEKS